MTEKTEKGSRKATRKTPHIYADCGGNVMEFAKDWCTGVDKRWLDLLTHTHGKYKLEGTSKTCTYFDPDLPIGDALLTANATNPLCVQCTMNTMGSQHPYMPPRGPDNPIITIVTDGVSSREDRAGELAVDGPVNVIYELLQKTAKQTNIDPDKDVRWLSTTRCAARCGKQQNLKTRGNWCRYFAVQDLMLHPPKLIMPVGSVALGLLSYKSNVQDWGGKLLTWRGWPDDWFTEPKFMLPRVDPITGKSDRTGHPIFGPAPNTRIPMYPVQSPLLINRLKNEKITIRWRKQVVDGVLLAREGVEALSYTRPWYRVSTDPKVVFDALQELIDCPGLIVSFDTETTGLKPWLGDRIVFMMFRWVDSNGNRKSIGFPWDYPESELVSHIPDLQPQVLKAMQSSVIVGHNLTFDMQFVAANFKLGNRAVENLVDAGKYDTWHMAYTHRQKNGSLGLEVIAYAYAPDLAGYEEDFTLLAELHKEQLHPAGEKGGHYAMCPKDKWDTHLIPYVMGDVEVTYEAREQIQGRLEQAWVYPDMPMAHPEVRGRFIKFSPPPRTWVYDNIISPSNIVLTKMMARGMYIDPEQLSDFEKTYPVRITEAKAKVMTMLPQIKKWADYKEQTTVTEKDGTGGWEFDLENKGLLKEMLFHDSCLGLSVQRLTKQGKKEFGDKPEDIDRMSLAERYEYAAVDRFTLNKLVADNPELSDLLEYRKLFKLYTTYIKPLRNCESKLVDKKARTGYPHLCPDSMIHASFMLTGTRGGRLCVAGDTQLEVKINDVKKLVEISDLWRYNDQHVTVKTHCGRWCRITRLYFKGYERMFEAVTESGFSVKATASHRVLSERGWQPLGVVAGQKLKLRVDLASWSRDGAERGKFSEACLAETNGLSADKRGYISADSLTQLEGISSAKIGLTGASTSAVGGCAKGQRKWPESAIGAAIKSPSGSPHSSRYSGGTDRQRNGDDAVFSRTEYPDVWVAEIGKRPSSSAGFDGISTEANGSGLPRFDSEFFTLLSRQGAVFQKGLSSIYNAAATGMVSEGYVPDAIYEAEGGQRRHGGNFVVDEPARTGIIPGIAGSEYPSFSRVHLQRKKEVRLRVIGNEHFDRSRRGVSHRRSKQNEHGSSRTARLPSAALYDAPGSVQNASGNFRDTGRVETVVQWRSVGVQAVWDIEVENDHSYLAQGIFHHNSCRDPNLQQLPNDADIKQMFASRFGARGCIYAGDLSQIELRLLAAACGDPNMIKAYYDNLDLHTLTTSRIFKLDYEMFSKGYMEKLQKEGRGKEAKELDLKRKIGKICNFLTGYGGGAFGLQTTLANSKIYMPLEECEHILDQFFDSYPTLKKYLSAYKYFIQQNCAAVSITGRVRIFEEVESEDTEAAAKALRAGCNHLIQATASDMMLVCLRVIEDAMRQQNLESLLVSTVHDSLVIDAVREELPAVHEIVYTVLNNIPEVFEMLFGEEYNSSWMIVPFGGDMSVGVDYGHQVATGINPDWDKLLA